MFQKITLPQEGKKITLKENGALNVPANPVIPFIEGDGIGPDIWRAAKEILEAAVTKAYAGERKIIWMEIYAGAKANKIYGENIWLPKETLEAVREYLVAIKGPLTTPVGGGIRSLNVALRQGLDLYVCQRPVRYFRGVPTPLKHPEKYDYTIFRENSEDIYVGIEWAAESPEAKKIINFLQEEMEVKNIRFPKTSGIGIKPISKEGTERLLRAAIEYAIKRGKKKVTLVHKGNIMKFTEGAFKQWGYELAEREYRGQIEINDVIADAFLQQILTRPDEYSVVATTNLNGDYISDALAACVGGIGLAPGANINYQTGVAIFEATHGTAPKYAGLDKVNPGSLILSGVMMFEYLGWPEAAEAIVAALEKTIEQKTVTYDLARLMEGAREVKCSQFAQAVIKNL